MGRYTALFLITSPFYCYVLLTYNKNELNPLCVKQHVVTVHEY